MSSSPPVVRTLVRKPQLRRAAPRPAAALALRQGGDPWPGSIPRPARAQRKTLLVRAMRALYDFCALVRDREPPPRPGPVLPQADLIEAWLMSDQWRHRAEAAEARAGELEARLEAAEMAALELRSRIICLQGKLATATATARYQTMTFALEHARAPLDSIGEPV